MRVAGAFRSPRALRHSPRDGVLIAAAMSHAAFLVTLPSAPVVALGLWWNANTVAHNFIHAPFFTGRWPNRAFAMFLSVVHGFPQSVWRERHLAHHAGRPPRVRLSPTLVVETLLVVSMWAVWASLSPRTFAGAYVPGWLGGLLLCRVQGHFEHARGTTSHYGRLYNALFFNDGYHIEHHLAPGRHWSELPARRARGRTSRWPPVLRWLDALTLEGLERLVLASPALQRLVLHVHERAFRRVLPAFVSARRVLIVGGGLFPRTALVVRRLLPEARLTIVDLDAEHLRIAAGFLDRTVDCRPARYTGTEPWPADLVIIPLSYVGDRNRLYETPPAPLLLVHDWIWRYRAGGAAILPLLKCVNVVALDRSSPFATGP